MQDHCQSNYFKNCLHEICNLRGAAEVFDLIKKMEIACAKVSISA